MLITFRKEDANTKNSSPTRTQGLGLDEVVTFGGQNLTKGFGAGNEQAFQVEHMSALDSEPAAKRK